MQQQIVSEAPFFFYYGSPLFEIQAIFKYAWGEESLWFTPFCQRLGQVHINLRELKVPKIFLTPLSPPLLLACKEILESLPMAGMI